MTESNSIIQFPIDTSNGAVKRQKSVFREFIQEDSKYIPEKERYHLYLSYACPWAHRTLIVIALKELESVISTSFVDPVRSEKGWQFGSNNSRYYDPINEFNYLMEA